MSYVAARNALVSHMHTPFVTAYPTVPIFYENAQELNMDEQPNMVVLVSVDFLDNERLDIHPVPNTQVYGEVTIRIFTRVGIGVAGHLDLFDYFTTLMSHKLISGITTETAAPDRKETVAGWMITDLAVPFSYFD